MSKSPYLYKNPLIWHLLGLPLDTYPGSAANNTRTLLSSQHPSLPSSVGILWSVLCSVTVNVSVSRALDCRFQGTSLGGVRDKAKMREHNVLTLPEVLDLLFKHSVKPCVLILSLFLTNSTRLDKVIFIEIHALPFQKSWVKRDWCHTIVTALCSTWKLKCLFTHADLLCQGMSMTFLNCIYGYTRNVRQCTGPGLWRYYVQPKPHVKRHCCKNDSQTFM